MITLFKENKVAVLFIAKFVVLYLVLNTLYGFYIESFSPTSDPVTIAVSQQVAFIVSSFQSSVSAVPHPFYAYVAIEKNYQTIVNVFEGCNGLNVMIVFVSFLLAFKGPLKSAAVFFILGLVIIYVMNLIRVTLLFEVAYFYPARLYFFHKYFFTGIIYLVVFAIWFFWIKHVRSRESRA